MEVKTVDALAVNVAEVAPCAIVTVGGNRAPEGEDVRAIAAPPIGAGDVRATVQLEVDGGAMACGLHEKPFKLDWLIVTVPPVVETPSIVPAPSDATAFSTCKTDVGCVDEDDTVSDTVAMTPPEIGVAFMPHKTHVLDPGALLQDTDLFTAAAAGPMVTPIDEKSAVAYAIVHWIAAGFAFEEFRVRSNITTAPGDAELDAKPSVTLCARPNDDENTAAVMIGRRTALIKAVAQKCAKGPRVRIKPYSLSDLKRRSVLRAAESLVRGAYSGA